MSGQNKRLPVSENIMACEVLQQALRVLCSNSVLYSSNLLIDAIIGITIDNAEIVFVNIHEIVEKDSQEDNGLSKITKPVTSNESAFHCRARNARRNSDEGNQEKSHNSYNKSESSHHPHVVSSAHLAYKSNDEATSVLDQTFKIKGENDIIQIEDDEDNYLKVSMNDCREPSVDKSCPGVIHSDVAEIKPETVEFSEQNDQFMYNGECFNNGVSYRDEDWSTEMKNNDSRVVDEHPDVSKVNLLSGKHGPRLMYRCRPCQRSFVYLGAYVRHKRLHQTRGHMFTATSRHDIHHFENTLTEGERSNHSLYSSDKVIATRSVVADEVGTIYTCSICGQKIRHQSSFNRHMKQHEGVVFRCDICNFQSSRRDCLLVHRRRCLMKCQQFLGVRQMNR